MAGRRMIDFFISFNKADREWAGWLAFVLEEEGYSVSIQTWDFRPGTNFVLEMQKAAGARRTLMVLSQDYLSSSFAQSEWAAAFTDDPEGKTGKLLPVMVKHCEPTGLLRQIVWIDLVGMSESSARAALISGLSQRRAKPEARPAFPGEAPTPAPFPSVAGSDPFSTRTPYVPEVGRKPTDADRRRFLKSSFAIITETFKAGLDAIKRSHGSRLDTDIEFKGESDFVAEAFIDGKSRSTCHVWIGGMLSRDGISYFEGRSFSDSAVNEILSVGDDGTQLFLKATIGRSFAGTAEGDLGRMSPETAADYLWRRFVRPLERP